jgi:hypothetical protein
LCNTCLHTHALRHDDPAAAMNCAERNLVFQVLEDIRSWCQAQRRNDLGALSLGDLNDHPVIIYVAKQDALCMTHHFVGEDNERGIAMHWMAFSAVSAVSSVS